MTAADIANLVPAFITAAVVLVVVAGGVLAMVWMHYQSTATDATPVAPEELRTVRAGLRGSGIAIATFGVGCLVACFLFKIPTWFGPASLLVPAAVIVDGVIFLVAAIKFKI